jgi:hypothetical protein
MNGRSSKSTWEAVDKEEAAIGIIELITFPQERVELLG